MSAEEIVIPVILAAGRGTRMRSALPKVLQPLAEKPLISHVFECLQRLGHRRPVVVIGHGAETVRASIPDGCGVVLQQPQQGTGHALKCALPAIDEAAVVLVLYGDVPLIRPETLQALLANRPNQGLAILTVNLKEPFGYGRIVRDDTGQVRRIVEERDATASEKILQEVNTGIMAAPAALWSRWLSEIRADNEQGEYYLTDCIELAVRDACPVVAHRCPDVDEVVGINDRTQLAVAEAVLRARRAEELMRAGALLRDPLHIEIRGPVHVGRDVMIDTGVVFEGEVTLEAGVRIGPFSYLKDCHIGENSVVLGHSNIENAQVGAGCRVGPFARLRPGARIEAHAHIGNFVEIKNSEIGAQSKVNHLSYVGDTTIGQGVNIGAGTITANYDGVNKHHTEIGDGASIGSNTVLVAPVKVGKEATVGAGSVVTADAPEGKLTLARPRQVLVEGWQPPRRRN